MLSFVYIALFFLLGLSCQSRVIRKSTTLLPALLFQRKPTSRDLTEEHLKSSCVLDELFTKSTTHVSKLHKPLGNSGIRKSDATMLMHPDSSKGKSTACSDDAGDTAVLVSSTDTTACPNEDGNVAGGGHAGDKEDRVASDARSAVKNPGGKQSKFRCELCPFAAISKLSLEEHIRVHTGEKPFECSVCSRAFAVKSNFVIHMRRHAGEKVECNICSQKLSSKQSLAIHMRRHTGEQPYKCSICPATFLYSKTFTRHKAEHAGQKPFTCKLCSVCFGTKPELEEHNRSHTKEMSSKCRLCSRVFDRTQSLVVHMVRHHRIT